jgi:hypothetical protein
MADLQSCSIEELDSIIRDVVRTNPWSDVNHFPVMRDITVIRNGGFVNTDSSSRCGNETIDGEEDEDADFNAMLIQMKLQGLRLVTGRSSI